MAKIFMSGVAVGVASVMLCGCGNKKIDHGKTVTTEREDENRGRRTKVYITFAGNLAFVQEEEGDVWRVLLPDAREGATVSTCPTPSQSCNPREIKIPKHAGIIVFNGPGLTFPNSEPWVLTDHDVEVSAGVGSRIDVKSIRKHLGNLGPVNTKILDTPLPAELSKLLTARLRLSGGKLEVPRSSKREGPEKFRAIQGNASSPPLTGDPMIATFLTYVIEASSISFKRTRFSTGEPVGQPRVLKGGGQFHVYVGQLPIEEDVDAKGVEEGYYADTHFHFLYNLAANPPGAPNRLVPMYPVTDHDVHDPIFTGPTGPRCMMAFLQSNSRLPTQDQ